MRDPGRRPVPSVPYLPTEKHAHGLFHRGYEAFKSAVQTDTDRDRNERTVAHGNLAKAVGGRPAADIINQAMFRDRKRPH